MDKNRCIGKTNSEKGLPWHLPKDLQHFRDLTKNKPVIFGRKTFEAFGGKPLPNRSNIVITSDTSYPSKGFDVVQNFKEAIDKAKSISENEIIIGGGSYVYQQALAHESTTHMILTEIDIEAEGDAYFPAFDESAWVEISRENQQENGVSYDFVVYEKKK